MAENDRKIKRKIKMTDYQKFIDEKIKIIAQTSEVVLDVGGGKPFTKWLAKYKSLFREGQLKVMDCDKSTTPDIVGDIQKIPLAENSVNAILCHSVLEHVDDPSAAVGEMFRILKPQGKIFVHVPSVYPYHAKKGHYPDNWRFFDDSIRLLFRDFSQTEIVKRGGYFFALSFFAPMQHKWRFVLNPVSNFLDVLFKTNRRTTTSGYYIYLIK